MQSLLGIGELVAELNEVAQVHYYNTARLSGADYLSILGALRSSLNLIENRMCIQMHFMSVLTSTRFRSL